MEAVAEAGPGADGNPHVANVNSENANLNNEKQANGIPTPPSNSSDVVAEPRKDEPQAPPRSKLKIVLIMASLCVSYLHPDHPRRIADFS